MPTTVFEELEMKFDEIVELISGDVFDSHQFILKLAQKYQKLYVRALAEYADNDQPFQTVHGEIAKRLKKRDDLVAYVETRPSQNIFDLDSDSAVWRKVKRRHE